MMNQVSRNGPEKTIMIQDTEQLKLEAKLDWYQELLMVCLLKKIIEHLRLIRLLRKLVYIENYHQGYPGRE